MANHKRELFLAEIQGHADRHKIAQRRAQQARRGYARDSARALEDLEDLRHALDEMESTARAMATLAASAIATPNKKSP